MVSCKRISLKGGNLIRQEGHEIIYYYYAQLATIIIQTMRLLIILTYYMVISESALALSM